MILTVSHIYYAILHIFVSQNHARWDERSLVTLNHSLLFYAEK